MNASKPEQGRIDGEAVAMSAAPHKASLRAQLSTHILPTSATMVGVCLTALYISLLVPRNQLRVVVDDLLAVDSLAFLISALLSFLAIRQVRRRAAKRLESRAELVFVLALVLLVIVALGLAFLIS